MKYWVIKGTNLKNKSMYFDNLKHGWCGENDKNQELKIKKATWFKTKKEAIEVIKEYGFGKSVHPVQILVDEIIENKR